MIDHMAHENISPQLFKVIERGYKICTICKLHNWMGHLIAWHKENTTQTIKPLPLVVPIIHAKCRPMGLNLNIKWSMTLNETLKPTWPRTLKYKPQYQPAHPRPSNQQWYAKFDTKYLQCVSRQDKKNNANCMLQLHSTWIAIKPTTLQWKP